MTKFFKTGKQGDYKMKFPFENSKATEVSKKEFIKDPSGKFVGYIEGDTAIISWNRISYKDGKIVLTRFKISGHDIQEEMPDMETAIRECTPASLKVDSFDEAVESFK